MGNKGVTLTGPRILELQICRAMVEATGIPKHQITDQRVVSACMQITMAHLQAGMKISWEFDDQRVNNGGPKLDKAHTN